MSNLRVKLRHSAQVEFIPVPEGIDPDAYIQAFLRREGDFSGDWVQLGSGEYVRYDCIISVRIPAPSSGTPGGPSRQG